LSSTPGGREFLAEVKKILSLAYTPKHMESGPGPLSHGHKYRLWHPCVRAEQGFGGFLDLRERSSLSKCLGAVIPLQIEFFLVIGLKKMFFLPVCQRRKEIILYFF